MRREFKVVVETRDDEALGHVTVEDMTEKGKIDIPCRAVDQKVIGNRETALAFMFREMAHGMYERCYPEYAKLQRRMQYPELHKGRLLFPGEPGHSSTTGIDPS